jgi:hypothetical protein
MKSILDPSFRYSPSFDTDLKRTFARIRRERGEDAERAEQATAKTVVKVSSIVGKTDGPMRNVLHVGSELLNRRIEKCVS